MPIIHTNTHTHTHTHTHTYTACKQNVCICAGNAHSFYKSKVKDHCTVNLLKTGLDMTVVDANNNVFV